MQPMRRPLPVVSLVVILALVGWWFWYSKRQAADAPVATNAGAPAGGATSGGGSGAAPGATKTPMATKPAAPPAPAAPGETLVRGAWGSQPGQFGRRRDPESNPEAPMAIAAGAHGDFAVVDQLNRRVQRFHNGKLTGTISIGGDTVQDIALGANGRTLLLDRLADGNVQVYDSAGNLVNEVTLAGAGVKEGGGVTGVFADDQGIYVESEHDKVVRVAGPDGKSDPNRPELLGRPTRDGRLLVSAALAGQGSDTATVSAFDRASGKPAWQTPVAFGAPILHLVMLDSDAHGMVYVAADVGRESPEPPYPIIEERIVVARLGPGGAPRGTITVPATQSADETFRPMSVDDDGNVYVMVPGERGLDVIRYSFP
jgi:hypothetical protein